jgi:hypothetical protein
MTSNADSQIRTALGLSRDYSTMHWPGTGPNAGPYGPNNAARRRGPYDDLQAFRRGAVGEACTLLRDAERAVRGLLAMARRETDGMWGIERTLLFIGELWA